MEKAPLSRPSTSSDVALPDPRDLLTLQASISQALDYIENKHLDALEQYQVLPLSKEIEALEPSRLAQMFHVTDIVYAKEEDFLQKAVTLLYTAYALRATVIVVLRSGGAASGGKCEYYMGLSCPNDRDNLSETVESYQDAFLGNFPGSKAVRLKNADLLELTDKIYNDSGSGASIITSISGIPSMRRPDKHSVTNFIQGIENLVASLRGCSYTLVVQADPVAQEDLRVLRQAYESCYTSLSSFAKTEYNYNLSRSEGTQSTRSEAISIGRQETDSLGTSIGTSNQHTHTEGTSTNLSVNAGAVLGQAVQAIGGVIGGVVSALGAPVIGAPIAMGAAGVGSFVQKMGLFASKGKNSSDSDSTGGSETESKQHSSGKSKQTTSSLSTGTSLQDSQGQSVQFSKEDKRIQDLMKLLEENLERLQMCENFGTFSGCAYVISNSSSVNRRVAALYSALMRGDSSFAQSAQIHTWEPAAPGYSDLKASLSHFCHPRFQFPLGDGYIPVTPSLLTSGQELALQIGLPKRAIPGVSVREVAEFGCNPPQDDNAGADDCPELKLGCVQHLTTDLPEIPVMLRANDLTAHTFITGSTGAGKSNAIYTMLKEVCALGREKSAPQESPPHFLIIEPAKGEYKDALGSYPGVLVYGTTPKRAPLLKLDPFSFPESIHILEHIDRLVEIFNACWPMYAAMPAVLKASIEQAYLSCGWSLSTSVCVGQRRFPTLKDVMGALPTVVDTKGFSKDTQGDYKGALLTRIESLTNGINGQVLCAGNGIDDAKLFDENVIVDLSRVGSSETKALLMGILILKLQEHRMDQRETGERSANSVLRHITVLEEAHNLLRRTSSEQSQEGSNLQGKAVEMLTNAIAEMRTYGEGFVIADQSPGLLDMAAIRNTNTKIILRLPDEGDRQLVGKAAGLNDNQIVELARLDTGVAAVFQNHWTEPVLCHISRFDDPQKPFVYAPPQSDVDALREIFFQCLLQDTPFPPEHTEPLKRWLRQLDVGQAAKQLLFQFAEGKPIEKKYKGALLYSLLHGKTLIQQVQRTAEPELAQALFDRHVSEQLCVSPELAQEIRLCIYTYAAKMIEHDAPQCSELKRYGGIK